jgi:hypothetical protein
MSHPTTSPGVVVACTLVGAVVGFVVAWVQPRRWLDKAPERADGIDRDRLKGLREAFRTSEQARLWAVAIAVSTGINAGISVGLYPVWADAWQGRSAGSAWSVAGAAMLLAAVATVAPLWYRRYRTPLSDEAAAVRSSSWLGGIWQELMRTSYPSTLFRTRIAVISIFFSVPLIGAATGMVALAWRATDLAENGYSRQLVLDLLAVRRTMFLFLGTAVALVVILLLVTGLMLRAFVTADKEMFGSQFKVGDLPLYGAMFSGLLASVFVPSYSVLRHACWTVVEGALACPAGGSCPAPDAAWFAQKNALVDFLGLNVSLAVGVTALLGIVTPLLTGFLQKYLGARERAADKPESPADEQRAEDVDASSSDRL